MDNFNNNKSKLEKLQDKLYDNDFKSETDTRSNLEMNQYDVKHDWESESATTADSEPKKIDLSEMPTQKRKGLGLFSYVLILAALFFVVSVGYASYVLWGGDQDINAREVDINIAGPVSVGAGEILSLDIIIQNNNQVELEAIDLIVEYPEGTKSIEDLVTDLRRTRDRIEPIAPGVVSRETINAALFGEEGDNKEITVSVEYQAVGSSAIFSKKKVFSIVLNAAPARVAVTGLKEVSSGQEIELTARVTSNSNTELKDLMLVANYPFGFEFLESDVETSFSNNVWIFDSIPPDSSKTVNIKGILTGQDDEERVFRFNTGLVSDNNREEIGVIFNNFIHEMIINRPFVGLDLLINGSSASIVSVKNASDVKSELIFSNNTNDYIRNLDIRLNINGTIFNESSVTSDSGFYRSIDNTLIFNRDTSSAFIEVDPRKKSSAKFNFSINNLSNLNIKNPEIKISAFLEADRISTNNLEQELKETFTKTIKVVSDVFVGSYVLREMGPFQNTGPIPPKAEQETTYTIQWSISNSFNDLENARITAVLPTYVSWNNAASPSTEVYSYDDKTRRLTWDIGNISAGTGRNSNPKEFHFQVTLLPSLPQIGQAPTLLRDVYFNARDTFTQTDIEISAPSPITKLSDTDAVKGHEIVVQ